MLTLERAIKGLHRDYTPTWFLNGQMRRKGTFVAGKMHGLWTQWYDDGRVMWKVIYKNGAQQ